MPHTVRASVVISTRNRERDLEACLQALSAAVTPEDEIILIDSASRGSTAIRELGLQFGARVLRSDKPGASRARNLGIREARGEVVAFTDDDAIVCPGWLEAIVAAFSEPAVDAVVGPVFALGSNPPSVLSPASGFEVARDRVYFSRSEEDWFQKIRFGAVGFGANLAVRHSSFEKSGLFREGLGAGAVMGGDESYFLLSMVDAGGVVLNEPGAGVFHPRPSAARARQIRQERLAYVLYIYLTRPHLRSMISTEVFGKVRSTSSPREGSVRGRRFELLREIGIAPWLAWRAIRSDRNGGSTS